MTLAIPEGLSELVAGARVELAWSWEDFATVWSLDGERYLKLRRTPYVYSFADEAARLRWARGRLPVPAVIDHGLEGEVEWLLLEALPGTDATKLKEDPEWIVPIFARGLRDFHAVPADDCPFDFRIDAALDHVRRRVATDDIDPTGMHTEHQHLSPAEALAHLEATRPPREDVVVCHGDYCFPNVLVEDGRVTGYLDLGELGLADRWWDLAIGSWTCTWNVGPGYEDLFLSSYGIEPDADRIAWYRLLYDLAS